MSPRLCRGAFGAATATLILATVALPAIPAVASAGGCPVFSGVVFRDRNANGVNDGVAAGEAGPAGVKVTAYGDADAVVASTITAKGGGFSLAIPGAQPVRVEFGALPPGYAPGPHGPDNGSTIVFPEAPNCTSSLGVVKVTRLNSDDHDVDVDDGHHDDQHHTATSSSIPPASSSSVPARDPSNDSGHTPGHETDHRAGSHPSTSSTTTTTSMAPSSVAPANRVNSSGFFLVSAAPAYLPMELGNRVWADTNGNGIQDPSESGIAGVTVALYLHNDRIDSTVTNAKGEYYFVGVMPNTTYTIKLDGAADLGAGGVIDARVWKPTTPFAGRPTIDSNAVSVNGLPTIIDATSGRLGSSDHSFDIGLVPKAHLTLIATAAPSPTPASGSQASFSLHISNIGPASAIHPIHLSGLAPVGLTFGSASPGFGCSVAGGVIDCVSGGDIARSAGADVVLAFSVAAPGGQPLALSLVATSSNDGSGYTDNTYRYAGTARQAAAVTSSGNTSPGSSSSNAGPASAPQVLGVTITRGSGLAFTGWPGLGLVSAAAVAIAGGWFTLFTRRAARRRPAFVRRSK